MHFIGVAHWFTFPVMNSNGTEARKNFPRSSILNSLALKLVQGLN
ncbi:hypothetical protein CFELI_03395 [Corynebacterium felinum]|uniref:Uncharacterized protein n=1 Tax=Corynebacterium felinum TaxID=131318 RepID=A0ABU2BC55_9CORY|nr:hypothetical protein [Corynebacterium felinum]WJY94320.1 hypothetical protein CFELI_03395 [Corynebacterium felinum]